MHKIVRAARIPMADPEESGAAASQCASAVTGYVADRCNLPPGGFTRAEAVRQLRTGAVSSELVNKVDALLAQCESARYGGAQEASANDFAGLARQCIDELERQRFA